MGNQEELRDLEEEKKTNQNANEGENKQKN